MPLHRGIENGKPYYQFGDSGKKYYYTKKHVKSRNAAKAKALQQGKAIEYSKHKK